MDLSHRIVIMNKGAVEQIGTPMEIYDNPISKYVASFVGEMNFIDEDSCVVGVRPEDIRINLNGEGLEGKIHTIMTLGHYVEVNVQANGSIIKCYVNRQDAQKYLVNDKVWLAFNKKFIYEK